MRRRVLLDKDGWGQGMHTISDSMEDHQLCNPRANNTNTREHGADNAGISRTVFLAVT